MSNREKEQVGKIDEEVGARLRRERKALRVTQAELGEVIGVGQQQIQKYERGDNRIGAGALYLLAHFLNMPTWQLFDELPPHDYPPKSGKIANQLGEGERESELVFSSLRSRYMADAIELLAAFDKIPNVKMRQQIIDLAKTLADTFIRRS